MHSMLTNPSEMIDYLNEHRGLKWGIPGVILVILGLIIGLGTMEQKILFLLSTPLLTTSAYVSHQRMLFLLQLIVTENAILAFLPNIPLNIRAALLVIPAVAVAGYLVYENEFSKDRYWPVGWAGLLLLAAGFSIAGTFTFYANVFLLVGPALIALYSLLGYLATGASVLLIWVILNIALGIRPAISLATRLLG